MTTGRRPGRRCDVLRRSRIRFHPRRAGTAPSWHPSTTEWGSRHREPRRAAPTLRDAAESVEATPERESESKPTEETADAADVTDANAAGSDGTTADGPASESASGAGGGTSGVSTTQPYIVRHAVRDNSVQFGRGERRTFFVHDVADGERELLDMGHTLDENCE